MAWPEEFSNATPMTAAQPPATEHRALWERGLAIAPALDALCCAIGGLFDDEWDWFLGIDGDAGSKVRAALFALHALMPPENDPFREWELFGAPRGTQDFVDVVSGIDACTKGMLADIAFDRANDGEYWKRAFKLTRVRYDVLLKAIVQLELLPELHPHVPAESLRKLQAPIPATTAADGAAIGVQAVSPSVIQSIERHTEPDGTVSGTPLALRTFDALNAGAVKPANAVAVEPAPESKVAIGAPARRTPKKVSKSEATRQEACER